MTTYVNKFTLPEALGVIDANLKKLATLNNQCDGSNHRRYCTPCKEFSCDICNGKMCQKASIRYCNGFICPQCAMRTRIQYMDFVVPSEKFSLSDFLKQYEKTISKEEYTQFMNTRLCDLIALRGGEWKK